MSILRFPPRRDRPPRLSDDEIRKAAVRADWRPVPPGYHRWRYRWLERRSSAGDVYAFTADRMVGCIWPSATFWSRLCPGAHFRDSGARNDSLVRQALSGREQPRELRARMDSFGSDRCGLD
jgi:hypothetical protein